MSDIDSRPNAPEELDRLIAAAGDAMTDQMVGRLSATLGNGMELLDRLNDEDTRDAVHSLLDELTALHRTGGLKATFELIHMISAMRNAMTDSMVERLAQFVEHMLTNLANEEIADLAHAAKEAVNEAVRESADYQAPGGIMATLKMLGDPKTQSSIVFLRTLAENLRKSELG
ncbi:MAG: hypothetical protein HOM52_13495 [Rhodospirillaceae bacterium]|jgi:uncharacterized protein YjgD (DUF1641 family)|nr:hypothetical protein [Rhodospirillaceae bacterium]MBT3928229.1 hypothetical protein [Rhodospirillaceae bacterium]MBT4425295.1 hypothetical protein [Rhodospirillaceae bacterium]MBT5039516.1 hypothetical protein [Rhodospirillaceae bacterium]MBT5674539.1 hypothetical protein [Rhodospirillaceae bacterium]